ncbi:helix-turn-helix domain-containing protein [Treponema sp.]|uniref:helix-turn-helix domain-containing protein n=1 Tax=Treponema sp. TaxID=166 RepID=UPI00388F88C1
MEYSTTALHSSKPRVEPVFVSQEIFAKALEENVSDRFRIILFTEGKFTAQINEVFVQVITPAVMCLNEKDLLKIPAEEQLQIKCREFLFNPKFLNKKLNFENILQKGTDAESEVIENRMLLKTHINSRELNYFRYINPEDARHINGLMEKAHFELCEQNSGWWPCKTRSFLTEILFFNAQLFELKQNANKEVTFFAAGSDFKPILDYIARSYDQKITLENLCSEFGTNRTDLNKLFKEKTGMTAIKYVIDLRLRIARSLLKDTDLPVERIAEQTGFSDSTHLERLFKQKYQMSPGEVR